MNRMGLTKKSEKVFWTSLLVYLTAYSGFYFTTQFTNSKISYEDEHGAFLKFKDVICKNGSACTDIKYLNVISVKSKYARTAVDVTVKQSFNESLLQENYQEFRSLLPWYVRIQFEDKLAIKTINGKPFQAN